MPAAVIFDVDGTIVDSNDLHVASWDEAFRHFGKEFTRAQLHAQIGKGGDKYIPEFLSAAEMRAFGQELEDFRAELFQKKYLEQVRPFPKVRDLFVRLRADGKKIALASSGNEREIAHYIELLDIDGLIEGRTSKSDVPHSKPSPDVFQSALRLLHLPAEDALVVGDTPYDVEAGKKIDLRTVALLCGGFREDELRAAGAIALFRDPADLFAGYARSPLCG